ncbi:membrane protein [Acrocarpospora pleiomorpha]|uniref:Membrane protein n=1 Tax=Acrocarpospora pleiomorpha TaxID=90975 RepID=A0A5M3XKA5_9ACTN|nr:GtrA family protein [Acrocarpospora pleiomorpha]GES21370.1 membrane protein [Acrocarpospora pleiomorpha]
MRSAHAVFGRLRLLARELTTFGMIGAVAFVISVPGANVLRYGVGLGPLTSVVLATVVASVFTYYAHRYWTWRSRGSSGHMQEFALFAMFNGIGLLIQVLCVGFTEYTLRLSNPVALNTANTMGVAAGTLFRFWAYRKWVFLPVTVKEKPAIPELAAESEGPAR